MEGAQKNISNDMWKFENGFLDREIEPVNDLCPSQRCYRHIWALQPQTHMSIN